MDNILKIMKELVSTIAVCLLIAGIVSAQGNDTGRKIERIQQFKQQYIKEVLALTDEDAAIFFPVYDAYEEERASHRKKLNNIKVGFMAKSDDELEKDLEEIVAIKEAQLETEKKYLEKFKQVISIRQVAALYHAENQFRKKLLERFGNN